MLNIEVVERPRLKKVVAFTLKRGDLACNHFMNFYNSRLCCACTHWISQQESVNIIIIYAVFYRMILVSMVPWSCRSETIQVV